jgi:sec-independent protein translocase protein TatB
VAQALGDQVSVLAAEIQNDDEITGHLRSCEVQDKMSCFNQHQRGRAKLQRERVLMFGIGLPEMMVIAVVALIFIGPDKLPGVMRSVGRSLVQLKRATNDVRTTVQDEMRDIEREIDLKDVKEELESEFGSVAKQAKLPFSNLDAPEKLVAVADALEGKPAEKAAPAGASEKTAQQDEASETDSLKEVPAEASPAPETAKSEKAPAEPSVT